jgi:hypothetical protein
LKQWKSNDSTKIKQDKEQGKQMQQCDAVDCVCELLCLCIIVAKTTEFAVVQMWKIGDQLNLSARISLA